MQSDGVEDTLWEQVCYETGVGALQGCLKYIKQYIISLAKLDKDLLRISRED